MIRRTIHAMVQTPTTRDKGLDVMRGLALIRVYLWHATGWAALTWIGALPVMFFVTGNLYVQSASRRSHGTVLRDRGKRLLLPFWLFGVLMLAAMYLVGAPDDFPHVRDLVGWLLPVTDPVGSAWQQGWITEPLWYLRTYTWLLLLAPLATIVVRKHRTAALLVALVLLTAAGQTWLDTRMWALQDLVTYGFFFVGGMAAGQRKLEGGRDVTRRALTAIAFGGGVASLVIAGIVEPLGGVVNNSHLLHMCVGVTWLAVGHLALPALRRAAAVTSLANVVNFLARRSLTFYLWHAPVLGALYVVAARLGLNSSLRTTLAVSAVGLGVTVLVVRVLGPVEDIAGGRRTVTTGRLRDRSLLSGALGCVAAVMLIVPAPVHMVLPPTPSQAPEAAEFAVDGSETFLLAPETVATQNAVTALPGTASTSSVTPVETRPADRVEPGTARKPTKPNTSTPTTTRPVDIDAPSAPHTITAVAAWNDIAPQADEATVAEAQAQAINWVIGESRPGIEVAILQPGRMRMTFAVDKDGNATSVSERMPLHSVTKSFTAAILLRAVEEGRITLDRPVGTLEAAPWFTLTQNITLAQLLSHRSGIPGYAETSAWKRDWKSIDGWEPALRAAQEDGPAFRPGTQVVYSSTNYIVAGLLAAQLYGAPIETLIEEQLLNPLGLNKTTVGRPEAGSPATGTGGMSAPITDVARWASAMWRDKTVMGAKANNIATWVDASALLGYGTFGYCPCAPKNGRTVAAAMGHNGAEATMRYYPATDTIIIMRLPGGVWPNVEPLITSLLQLTR